jgi:AcrR family transcriptional regulator
MLPVKRVQAHGRRLEKTPLSRERVLAAALALADAEGLASLTMRKLAESLDCEAMSLYHYVKDKAALLHALAEAVVAEVVAVTVGRPVATDAGDWRDVVRARCLSAREVMLRHPWAPGLLMSQEQAPPSANRVFEGLVATMVEAGLGYDLAHRAIHSLGSMVLGFTQELFEPTAEDEGASPEEMAEMGVDLPHLSRLAQTVVHEAEGSLSVCDTRAEFEFTLGLILDGLEAHRPA